MAVTLLVTDRNLNVVGDPIVDWTSVDATARYNAVGSGQFVIPAYGSVRDQIRASHRVVVVRDRRVFLAGPIERKLLERSDDGENSGIGTLTVTFGDDLAWVAGRVAYPNPAVTPEEQLVDQWTYSGNAELAMYALVNANAGPGALVPRRVPRMVMAAPTGIGGTVNVSTRLEPVADVLRRVALAGGGLGFRTKQVGNQIVFEVYQPQDKSGEVRFGFNLGNLRYLAYEEVAPTASTAIVGGQGEGADRYLIERGNATSEAEWGRTETLVSRPGSSPLADLEADAAEALAETGASARLQTSAWDTDTQRYPDHYDLGTRVSVAVGRGEEVSELVRLVHLQAWATADELVSAMVGTQEASHDPEWVQKMRAVDRRLGRLERTAVTVA